MLLHFFFSYEKIPDLELFFMATLVISMIAGSVSTLVGVYHAFAIYVLFNSIPIVIVFTHHGGKMFEVFALTTFIFMYVMLKNGFKHYHSLKENILLKENFESRVKNATLKLEQQNIKLNESIDNFQDLLDTSMVMIAFHNEEGLMVEINKSAAIKFGYKNKADAIGKPAVNLLSKESIPIAVEALKKKTAEPYELVLRRVDETEFPALVSAKYTILNGQRVRMTTMMDLTEIKANEKLLQHQSKLAQMGEMISMIAHQWRQPLAAISATSIDLNIKAQLDKADKETIEKNTNEISKYTQHLSDTIDDFRNFFKPDKDKKLTNYNKLVRDTLSIVKSSLQSKNIALSIYLDCENEFYSFENELKQVILNLIKNAEDALLENKIINPNIKISSYVVERDENIKFVLEVVDNAGGIPKEIMNNIFDPYFSTKMKKDGLGLGLYMSKIIVQDHCGGKLEVSNDKDGAIFKIILGENL